MDKFFTDSIKTAISVKNLGHENISLYGISSITPAYLGWWRVDQFVSVQHKDVIMRIVFLQERERAL